MDQAVDEAKHFDLLTGLDLNPCLFHGVRYCWKWSSPAVGFEMAMERAKTIGNCKTYITNMSWHGGLREHAKEVVGKLFDLRDDVMA